MPEIPGFSLPVRAGDIACDIFRADDLEAVAACLATTFSESEPMLRALGVTSDELYDLAELLCRNALSSDLSRDLSLVAKDGKSGKVAAFSLADDFLEWQPERVREIDTKIWPVFALVAELDREYQKTRKTTNPGEIFHLSFLGAYRHYRNRKIAVTLVENHLRLAAAKGFSGAVAEVTGPVSRHILVDRFGFAEKFKVDYKTYLHSGVPVFQNIQDASYCILVEKRFPGGKAVP